MTLHPGAKSSEYRLTLYVLALAAFLISLAFTAVMTRKDTGAIAAFCGLGTAAVAGMQMVSSFYSAHRTKLKECQCHDEGK